MTIASISPVVVLSISSDALRIVLVYEIHFNAVFLMFYL